jgi:N-acetylmuramoyl-L-alanine amidase
MATHIVEQGECLARIAERYGFRSFRTVYDDPGNAALRERRPNPDLLYPGDVVFIPEKRRKEVPRSTGLRHLFRVAGQRRVLRLVIEDVAGEKMKSAEYELTIDGKVERGVIGADGLIEHEIPLDATAGTLIVKYLINDFKLTGHAGQKVVGQYVWPLEIAHLNPVKNAADKGVSGYQARLRNMGYDPGPIDGIVGPRTKAALIAFQEDNPPLSVDGICGPATLAKLVELYGC